MIELIGLALIIIGSFGLIRMPTIYNRIHASGLISYGTYILILYFGLRSSITLLTKSLILVGLLFVVSPAINSMIAYSAYKRKIEYPKGEKK
jgi:monovalent cation/proton antiporter MnhG/PhaG subunit